MYGPHGHHPKHHLRYYIVLTTVVIGGIFLLLLMNNNKEDYGITSFTVRDFGGEKADSEEGMLEGTGNDFFDVKKVPLDEDGSVEQVFSKEVEKNNKEVDVSLSFNKIPSVRKEAKITTMELTFDDLTTKISVNNDKLELSNLQEVSLRIAGFVGKLNFDSQGISLDGKARSIAVNDVKLSSRGEIRISFEDLDYDSLDIDEIELMDFELDRGDGSLNVAEKLSYSLEQDQMKIFYFNGKLAIERGFDTSMNLDGVARGIMVSGALMNFNLR